MVFQSSSPAHPPSSPHLSQSDLECRMADKGAIWFGKATTGIGTPGGRQGAAQKLDGHFGQTCIGFECKRANGANAFLRN